MEVDFSRQVNIEPSVIYATVETTEQFKMKKQKESDDDIRYEHSTFWNDRVILFYIYPMKSFSFQKSDRIVISSALYVSLICST